MIVCVVHGGVQAAVQPWALGQIADTSSPSSAMKAIEGLRSVDSFFRSERTLLFGMKTTPDAFEESEALVERANAGLRAWFNHFGGNRRRQATGVALPRDTRISIRPSPSPSSFVSGTRHRPRTTLRSRKRSPRSPDRSRPLPGSRRRLAAALRTVRGKRPESFFEKVGNLLNITGGRASLSSFGGKSPIPTGTSSSKPPSTRRSFRSPGRRATTSASSCCRPSRR